MIKVKIMEFEQFKVTTARKLEGRVEGLLAAHGKDFITSPIGALDLSFEGISPDMVLDKSHGHHRLS